MIAYGRNTAEVIKDAAEWNRSVRGACTTVGHSAANFSSIVPIVTRANIKKGNNADSEISQELGMEGGYEENIELSQYRSTKRR